MTDRELFQKAFEALEDMMEEFRRYDLPYGSKAYAKAKDARLYLYARLSKPEQEPVACVQDLGEVKRKHLVYEKGMDWKDPLYTTPPQRTWVGYRDWETDRKSTRLNSSH